MNYDPAKKKPRGPKRLAGVVMERDLKPSETMKNCQSGIQ